MIVIGLILLACAAVLGIDLAATNNDAIDIEAFGRTVSTNTGSLVVAGVVIALAAAVGVLLTVDGARRRRARRAEAREIRDERERLAATVMEERTARENAEAATRAAMAQASARRAERREGEGLDLRDSSPNDTERRVEA